MTARRSLRCAVLAALVACAHGEPFTTPPTGSIQPLNAGPPARLTYDQSADVAAAWLPDESGLMYSGVRADLADVRCLRTMPPTGGRVVRSLCPGRADVFNEFGVSAPAPDGRVAFVRVSNPGGGALPSLTEIVIAPPDSVTTPTILRSVPFTLPGQSTFNLVTHLRWLGSGALLYRGGLAGYVCDVNVVCNAGSVIFVQTGMALVVQPLDSAAGGPTMIPGTAYASSVAVGADGDVIYYTINGDSRVYRRVMSTGVVNVMANIAGGVVRDVQVAGNWLVVVAGGAVTPFVAQGIGPVQLDQGGDLILVDLTNGDEFTTIGVRYRHPALSPSGRRLVAEANGDLWLFDLP